MDDYSLEDEMDDYFLGTPEEAIGPQTTWTRQEAYLAYRQVVFQTVCPKPVDFRDAMQN